MVMITNVCGIMESMNGLHTITIIISDSYCLNYSYMHHLYSSMSVNYSVCVCIIKVNEKDF